MLELDLMLERFLDEGFPALSAEGQGLFVRFLTRPDPILYDWLMGYTEVPDPAERVLVAKIRACNLACRP